VLKISANKYEIMVV